MNPHLHKLQSYPFEKLRQLFSGLTPNPAYVPISLGIGEPRHATPGRIIDALTGALDAYASYPATAGSPALRASIAAWISRRYAIPALDADTQILPVNGSREALFSLAQAVIAPTPADAPPALVVCPNPFYQIYEGAAFLAGAEPYFANAQPERNFAPDFASIPPEIWARVQLVYVCSPGNPTGAVLDFDAWATLFALSDRYGFVIAADECYSEIYFRSTPPLGSLQVAHALGRSDFARLVVLSSLSKRSNVPGMRSGFVAGDASIIKPFLLYRTYHGSAMSGAVQAASIAAWDDETHVQENRALYQEKFAQVMPILRNVLDVHLPDAAFYLWAEVRSVSGLSDTEFARALYAAYNVTVLPGSFLARAAHGINPGADRVRMALVAEPAECVEAARRIEAFCRDLRPV